jgi:hypothetical protein
MNQQHKADFLIGMGKFINLFTAEDLSIVGAFHGSLPHKPVSKQQVDKQNYHGN